MRRNSQLKEVNSIGDQQKGGRLVAGFCCDCYLCVGKWSLFCHQHLEGFFFFFFLKPILLFCRNIKALAIFFLSHIALIWRDSALTRHSFFSDFCSSYRKCLILAKTAKDLQYACCFLTGAYEPNFNSETAQMLPACFTFAMYKQSSRPDRGNAVLTGA